MTYEVEPVMKFQVGSAENPTEFINQTLDHEFLNTIYVEQIFNDKNYKLKLEFGKVKVKSDFKARLVVIENGIEKIIL